MASQIVGSEKIPGSITVTRGSETQLTITEQYEFLVESDDKFATRQEIVFNTPGLPITGVLYVSNGLVCKSKRAERLAENPFYWKVVCEFESGREDQKQSTSQPDSNDPTTWVPVFVVDSFETKDRVLVKDKSASQEPIVNGAGTRFETPLVEKITLCSFSFVQFEDSSLTLKTIMDRNETINTSTLDVYAAKTLKLNVTEAALGYYAGVLCWRIAYKVTYDRDTWDTTLFNVGPFYKSGGTLLPYKYKGVQIVGNLEDDGTMRSMLSAPLTITFQDKRDIDFSFIRTS
jgi:hypothetical protein